MNKARSFFCCLLFLPVLVFSQSTAMVDGHPAWIMQGNIYEVNVRQYTPEGSFKAFAPNLDRLKAMGVQTLWFMPINPISRVDRKGTLGSYYAVSDYDAVNPEFGTLADFKELVRLIHQKGMKVIIDWVPNHTGADHRWLKAHPDFYTKDSTGNAAIPFGWSDTRQLDYSNRIMQDSMIASMRFWITQTNIDGFRCDVAWNVPGSFWTRCIGQLRAMKNVFMLAEGDKSYLPRSGFDAVYAWDMFHMMAKIAAGERPAFALDSIRRAYDTLYPKNALELNFTSNHDENSWNKADYGLFPGASHAPFAVLAMTLPGVPLVYSGQEEPVLRPLSFFEKDTIVFGKFERAEFYSHLLNLRANNPALASNASFRKLSSGTNASVYSYLREGGGKRVLVILNLSASDANYLIPISLHGIWHEVFTGTAMEIGTGKSMKLEPWAVRVYQY
ncbi:MAG: alpha-amylase family glycosyl hydrolase [Bacteroidota bacterium]|nr:alpha-amylase family glycosyl hydrolase [Bacteroidota bacterium]MDP4216490.1 alpha-amylase family glycosyl hydrolase [Bacteroidota bacterium]MDP4246237.1 alpha-amylase family glycosyl hydrolase [Bacteroidota bacterium]MDP4254747.1 alpha-amylase family glycosyl hydrolase [Bacteroidota bacterium]MDP4260615.1 alpha-amylase family glycosyl hydrolase [Bacteroidota bacterium]